MKPTNRLRVIDPHVLRHVMEHPARGRRWSVRTLAEVVGISPALLGHLRSGERVSVDATVAGRIAEAVGCQTQILFTSSLSTDSDDITRVAS